MKSSPHPNSDRPLARNRSWWRAASILLLAVAVAAPAWAYTIYFKDGSRLIAREKFHIEGEQVVIELQNGTIATYDADAIDYERTERANRRNSGTALILEGNEVREVPVDEIPRNESPRTLRDLIEAGEAGIRNAPEPGPIRRNRPQEPQEPRQPDLPRTSGGWVDFRELDKEPLAREGLARELRELFEQREMADTEVYQGTREDRALVVVTTGSEAGVFRGMVVAASALLQIRERQPGSLAAVELLLVSSNGSRAGQFVITPTEAAQLITRQVDVTSFFLDNVQF